jgi:hypothetical protein
VSSRHNASLVVALGVASLAATSLAAMVATSELLVESFGRPVPERLDPPFPGLRPPGGPAPEAGRSGVVVVVERRPARRHRVIAARPPLDRPVWPKPTPARRPLRRHHPRPPRPEPGRPSHPPKRWPDSKPPPPKHPPVPSPPHRRITTTTRALGRPAPTVPPGTSTGAAGTMMGPGATAATTGATSRSAAPGRARGSAGATAGTTGSAGGTGTAIGDWTRTRPGSGTRSERRASAGPASARAGRSFRKKSRNDPGTLSEDAVREAS